MAARLKVFVTSDGLTDYVVAVSSKAKALAAWGVRQDVFKEGAAYETDDKALVKAALAQPGEVLRRPAGGREKLAKLKPAKAAKRSGPTKAQLGNVATLEKQLADLDAVHDRAAAALERARADLDAREETLHARHERQRGKLAAALSAARQALG
jgi:hypothetical protein